MSPIYRNFIRLVTVVLIAIVWTTKFDFLALNSFLAYIPIELSFQIKRIEKTKLQLVLLFFWLLFFPNVPYLATDLVHADMVNIYSKHNSIETVRGWGFILLLFLVVFAYNIWGFAEGISLAGYFKRKLRMNRFVTLMIVSIVCVLSSMAMYAGRFAPRLHSIYFVTDPLRVVDIIFLNWSMKKLEFIGLFFLLHVGIIGTLYVMTRINRERDFETLKQTNYQRKH